MIGFPGRNRPLSAAFYKMTENKLCYGLSTATSMGSYFKLEDGTAFLVEVNEPNTTTRGGSGIQRVNAPRTGRLC